MFKNKMLWNPENIDEYREPLQQLVIVEKPETFVFFVSIFVAE